MDNFEKDQLTELPIVATRERCHGGTYIVTGANQGLGYEAAKHLVDATAAKVILAVRSQGKGDEAVTRIEADTGVKDVAEVWLLDMGSYASIKAFAKKVEGLDRLDAIIENAGIALSEWSLSDGLETTTIVNITGTMLLAGLLMPKLEYGAQKFGITPQLCIVGSQVAFTVPGALEKMNGNVITWMNNKENGMEGRYAVSKLVLYYAFREFSKRKPVSSTGVAMTYVNPGLCVTDLNRQTEEKERAEIDAMKAKLGRTPEQGSRTLLHGALGGKDTHGKYLSECTAKE